VQLNPLRMIVLLFAWTISNLMQAADEVDYVRDVKPIFKMHCFRCHGPLKSAAGLRIDTKARALQGGESGPALIPGNATDSSLVQRIIADDDSRMPPEGARLSDQEIATLTHWIDAGAVSPADEFAEDPRSHWAYQPIQRPEVPSATDTHWSNNPIDAFIAQKHHLGRVIARPPAADHILLRRVYLDLTGLPPSRDQLRVFLDDKSPRAYENVVDQLLTSPHYGERWGRHWLDVWRYSDWYGFQSEIRFSQKNIWHWRDWVVESLNADKGYAQMVMEMLAGDEMVPFHPGNLRATGFLVRNRNTDSREQWIRDTVEHTAKAFLGLTMACVQCHDHPYDPIWHDEYYRYRNIFEPVQVGIDSGGGGPDDVDLAGIPRIFDQNRNATTKFFIRGNEKTPDENRTITPGVPQVLLGKWTDPAEVQLPPLARIPHLREPVHQQTLARLQHNIQQAEQQIVSATTYLAQTRQRIITNSSDDSTANTDTLLVEPFQDMQTDLWKQGRGKWEYRGDHLVQTLVDEPRDCYLEAVHKPGANFTLRLRLRITGGTQRLVGVMFNRSPNGNHGEAVLLSANEDAAGLRFFFEYGAERHFHDQHARDLPIQLDEEFVLRVDVRGKLVNIYVNDLLQQAYQVTSDAGSLRLLTIDAAVEFHHLRIDPLPADAPMVPAGRIPLFAAIAQLDKTHACHISFSEAVIEHSQLQLNINQAELASYQTTWSADSLKWLYPPPAGDEAATKAHKTQHDELAIAAQGAQRQLAHAKAREARFTAMHELAGATQRADAAAQADETFAKAVEDATTQLETRTSELETAKKTLAEPLLPQYQGLSGSYGSSSGRRLSLARWLADSNHPLTARVAVNHIWLRHFGQALVATVFDFGLSGAKPSHPELLNWLAAELQQPSQVFGEQNRWMDGEAATGPWSMKHIHRLIVTSRAYRSESTPSKTNRIIDPDNRWLWRMPRQRMDAETVRDSILFVAGELDTTMGGPDLPCDDGMACPRRSLYFHRSPETQMGFLKLFDAADTTECYQRHVSIVPHQALALLNSQLSLVQSRQLARRFSKTFIDDTAFITATFEQVLSRNATESELNLCLDFLTVREQVYRSEEHPVATVQDFTDVNRPSMDSRLHARENLVHTLLNHHDFISIQ